MKKIVALPSGPDESKWSYGKQLFLFLFGLLSLYFLKSTLFDSEEGFVESEFELMAYNHIEQGISEGGISWDLNTMGSCLDISNLQLGSDLKTAQDIIGLCENQGWDLCVSLEGDLNDDASGWLTFKEASGVMDLGLALTAHGEPQSDIELSHNFMHELGHMKLKCQDSPQTLILHWKDVIPKMPMPWVRDHSGMLELALNSYEHHKFFPQLKAQGHNPYLTNTAQVSIPRSLKDVVSTVLYYWDRSPNEALFKTHIYPQIREGILQNSDKTPLSKKALKKGFKIANRIMAAFHDGPTSNDALATVYQDLLDLYFPGDHQFKVSFEWIGKNRGRKTNHLRLRVGE